MKEIDRFKGGRHYVHATDELLAAEPLLIGVKHFTFTSRKVGTYVARWEESGKGGNEAHMETIARLIAEVGDGTRRTFECLQDTSRPITINVPFDEDALAEDATYENGTLTCRVSADFTLWEHLSTLQKVLLQRHIGHLHWYFVRLEFGAPVCWPPNAAPTSLALHYRQQKGLLFLSDVLLDGRVSGEIAFAKR